MSYVDEVYERVVAQNPAQPEFHQAVKEVLESLRVGDKAPNVYFKDAFESAEKTGHVFGYPMTVSELENNLTQNCIPLGVKDWDYNDYQDKFLVQRRRMMAKKIEEYYKKL